MEKRVITRFPPSPTGYFHIGSARTALFNHLFAAHEGGQMLLRFEDTDKERSKKEFEEDIIEGLRWLGIPFQTPSVMRQSERLDIYRPYIRQLLESGRAYVAEAAEGEPEKQVIRFRNPGGTVSFEDRIRGPVSFDTGELGDFIIARSESEPLYHLAVVIDDHEMEVTHVIRGEDHISNTPRQILILEALGFSRPLYAHIPLILAPDRSKLSKRHGAVSVNEYRRGGFIPEALINYLALLGWHPEGEQELFSLNELTQSFTLERVQKGGAIFDTAKLRWFNREHLRRLSDEEYADRLKNFMKDRNEEAPDYLPKAVLLLKERAETLSDAATILRDDCSFFQSKLTYEQKLLLQGGKIAKEDAAKHLHAAGELLKSISGGEFSAEAVKNAIFPYATEAGRGAVLWPLRIALSGSEKSPDPFTIASLLGKEATLSRIAQAEALAVQ